MADDQTKPQEDGPSGAVMAIMAVILAAIGYFVVTSLIDRTRQQDCVIAGRKDCAPIAVSR